MSTQHVRVSAHLPVQALTIISRNRCAAAISLKLVLNQPRQTDSHGSKDRHCLYRFNAKDRGRVQSPVQNS